MLTLNLSEAEIQELNYERFQYPDPKVQKRMHVLYFKALEYSHTEITVLADVHLNSITNFIKIYKAGGIESLKELKYLQPESELTEFENSIKAEFIKQPPLTVKEAASRIASMTGIKRSLTQVRSFIKNMGMSYRKTGHIPAKADPVKQKKFVDTKLKPLIREAKKGNCHLLFLDAAHFVYGPFLCFLWSFVRQFIPSPAGRQRINILGALDAITKELIHISNFTYINAETLGIFLKRINWFYNDSLPIYIILDNARYQHCEYVKEMAKQMGIKLIFLPPYSPNLNLIERLWKFTKKNVLYGKYYESFNEFQTAILAFLGNINKRNKLKSELNSLITLNFQLFENSQNLAA
jgi:transposase